MASVETRLTVLFDAATGPAICIAEPAPVVVIAMLPTGLLTAPSTSGPAFTRPMLPLPLLENANVPTALAPLNAAPPTELPVNVPAVMTLPLASEIAPVAVSVTVSPGLERLATVSACALSKPMGPLASANGPNVVTRLLPEKFAPPLELPVSVAAETAPAV